MSTDMFPDSFVKHVVDHHHAMRQRLALAYHEAMTATHARGSVSIHAGVDVVQWMKDQCVRSDDRPWMPAQTTVWGFPVVVAPDELGPDHLSVHVVTVIA